MFGWLKSREREVRQLNRDATSIVEMTRHTYRADRQREIALLAREKIRQIEDLCTEDETCRQRELDRVKTLHREARRNLDQVALTGHTLVIIHLRARSMGEDCAPAREVIDGFIAEWSHAADDSAVLPG